MVREIAVKLSKRCRHKASFFWGGASEGEVFITRNDNLRLTIHIKQSMIGITNHT